MRLVGAHGCHWAPDLSKAYQRNVQVLCLGIKDRLGRVIDSEVLLQNVVYMIACAFL